MYPLTTRQRPVKLQSARRRVPIKPLVFVTCLGLLAVWGEESFPDVDTVETPEPTSDQREGLTASALLGENGAPPKFVHYDYFMPMGDWEPARHIFEGIIEAPAFRSYRRNPRQSKGATEIGIPGFQLRFTSHGDILLPVDRDRILDLDEKWSIIASAGRIWHEAADGNWSRASFPFTLINRRGLVPHYGVATFLFDDRTVSHIRLQIAQETANWAQLDIWGQVPMTYAPESIAGASEARTSYDRVLESRIAMRPWQELADEYGRAFENFDGIDNRENISVSGLMVDDVFYLRPCRTRAGPHPYCREMRHGVFSISKSLGAGVTMLWLAQKYGADVFDAKITDYVSIPAEHDGWADVTFGHALDMVTGIGNTVPRRVGYYVETDGSSVSRMMFAADSMGDKLAVAGQFRDYPWGPGEVFRYRTADTTVLAAAMESYVRQREGAATDLWDTLTSEVFSHLGIDRIPVRRSNEPDGRQGTPLLGWGLYLTLDDALKITRLIQNGGAVDGKQLLHPGLTQRAISTDFERGHPNGWRGKGRVEGRYELSFWLTPHESTSECNIRIPVMAGLGGNYLVFMPNQTIGLRFADGHDDNPGTWDNAGIRNVSDQIRSFCDWIR